MVAIEPYMSNVHHFHAGVRHSHFQDRILLVRNAMSHRHGVVTMCDNSDNKGGISVLLPGQPSVQAATGVNKNVPTIIMDDLLQVVSTDIAIIKIDIGE